MLSWDMTEKMAKLLLSEQALGFGQKNGDQVDESKIQKCLLQEK